MENRKSFKIVAKAKRVQFEYFAEFETEGVPKFEGKDEVVIPGEPDIEEVKRKLEDVVYNKLISHLERNKAPKDVVLREDPVLTILESSTLKNEITAMPK
ncbi:MULTISPECIES: hypothetical protein [Vibrio harveyi group]|uniref:hypothetical protein n=1 Tax=Vibrio harveyi group TaxID=717610 RepID=UPI002362ECE6|nr:hypothetical protein [Vibrio parahaemolyticus]ELJ9746483.1 hypothetical protein [Vibrio parahaemolyticus]